MQISTRVSIENFNLFTSPSQFSDNSIIFEKAKGPGFNNLLHQVSICVTGLIKVTFLLADSTIQELFYYFSVTLTVTFIILFGCGHVLPLYLGVSVTGSPQRQRCGGSVSCCTVFILFFFLLSVLKWRCHKNEEVVFLIILFHSWIFFETFQLSLMEFPARANE